MRLCVWGRRGVSQFVFGIYVGICVVHVRVLVFGWKSEFHSISTTAVPQRYRNFCNLYVSVFECAGVLVCARYLCGHTCCTCVCVCVCVCLWVGLWKSEFHNLSSMFVPELHRGLFRKFTQLRLYAGHIGTAI